MTTSTAKRPVELRSASGRFFFVFGVCLITLPLLLHAVIIDRQAPWEDEIFLVSTSLSLARSQPPVMSVMAHFPNTDSPIKFYGPVTFEAGAWLIRAFGLSMTVWRLVSFGGVILSAFASSRLVRLAGGDQWAQLIAASAVALVGTIASEQPGRWDFITVGLFLTALLVLLQGLMASRGTLLWKAALAGVLIGVCLASTPRPLTLCGAVLAATVLVAALCPSVRVSLPLGSITMLASAVTTQTLLLLPWGLDTLSWYSFMRRGTQLDFRNATPLTGPGTWGLGLHLHKTVFLVGACFLAVAILAATSNRRLRVADDRLPFKLFLTLFATLNILLLTVLVGRAFGQSAYWLPMAVIAAMSWLDWRLLRKGRFELPAAVLISICLLVLLFQEFREIVPVLLTWNRRYTPGVTALVERSLPKGVDVYGPMSGYFYSVELAGDKYLYLYSQGRFVLPFLPANSASGSDTPEAFDKEICAHPTYIIWSETNDAPQPLDETMPKLFADRLEPKVGELHQPPLASWKLPLLKELGAVNQKYGFYDMAIYPLKSLSPCGKQ